jgi:hypothetical protein
MIDLFGELLATGFREMDEPPPNIDTMAFCLAGSVWETIRRHAAEHRLHELPDALPAISHVCVSTLYGLPEARRVSAPACGIGASPRGSPYRRVPPRTVPVQPCE